mmetsp:Transcript_5181/g.14641  ORF Transcript_5181/g.14641 Transcript_5181/m.14641 type:complete len:247 (+) Transcript_5181:493-1233(+)
MASPATQRLTPWGYSDERAGSFSCSHSQMRWLTSPRLCCEEIWMGPTTRPPWASSTKMRILPRRIWSCSYRLFSCSRCFCLCASIAADCLVSCSRAELARSSPTHRSACIWLWTSVWTPPRSCVRKMRLMAMPFMSGNATSWRSFTAFGTSFDRCAFAAVIAWIFSSTRASLRFSSRFSLMTCSFFLQRTHSSSTWSCQSFIMVSWRWYHSSLNSLMASISLSSSTSMIDCSSVLFTSTSRIGSTS